MKNKLILLTFCGWIISSAIFSQGTLQQKTQRFDPHAVSGIVLPFDFAQATFAQAIQNSALKGQTITHVDLVYTAYKESAAFDQKQLNENRKRKLLAALPQLQKSSITWRYIEQTEAQTAEEARSYFHGFVLYTTSTLNTDEKRAFFQSFSVPKETFQVDGSIAHKWVTKSGSTLHLPAESVCHANGKKVEGKFQLTYTEFRHSADMALSGIPMVYEQNGVAHNFNSSGMFEIRATQKGENLILKKPMQVDFVCTNQNDDVDFYAMNDKDGQWKKLHPIRFDKNGGATVKNAVQNQPDNLVVPIGWNMSWTEGKLSTRLKCSPNIFPIVLKALQEDESTRKKISNVNHKDFSLNVANNSVKDAHKVVNRALNNPGNQDFAGMPAKREQLKFDRGRDQNATLLAAGADKGHTYPSLVSGLNCDNFGVFNCDQIYRVGTPIAVTPKYVNAENNQPIANQHVACLIDKSVSGSFSFDPKQLICNGESQNIVLLFTDDKSVYILKEADFKKAVEANPTAPVFSMTNISAKATSSGELKKVLGI